MIPSNLELTDTFGSSQYSWLSKDRKTVVNVTRGGADLTVEEIDLRLMNIIKDFVEESNNLKVSRLQSV